MPLIEMKSFLAVGAGGAGGTGTPQLNEPPTTPPITPLTSAVFSPIPTRQEIDASVGRARLQSRLLAPKTDLSAINKNFGSNTFTAGNTPSFPHNELNVAPIPTTLYLDKKMDFASIFSPINKATNVYNLNNNPTPLQKISTVGINGLNNYATIPNQYGFTFTPLNNSDNKFPTTRPTTSLESRLYFNHQKDREINAGFTRPGLGLDNYYNQNFESNIRMGISNRPKVVRAIGQRWGDDAFNLPLVPGIVETGLDILSKTASPAFGRPISTFINTYKADVFRIGELLTSATYNAKQVYLHRQNPYDQIASKLYGFKGDVSTLNIGDNKFSQLLISAASSGVLDINPQRYNPGSIFSVPGVSGMMFNRNGTNIGDAIASSAIDVGKDVLGLVGDHSVRAIASAQKKLGKLISTNLGPLIDSVGQSLDITGNSISGFASKLGAGTSIAGNFGTVGMAVATSANKLAFHVEKIYQSPTVQKPLTAVKSFIGKSKARTDQIRETSKVFLDDVASVSKFQLSKVHPRAFENTGVDRVNLIPYGDSTTFENEDYTTLDLIPFKFADARTGKQMVFRAILSGITDTFSPEYSSERYLGRPDSVYVYQGTNREISFNFDVYPKSDTEMTVLWTKLNYLAGQTYPGWDVSGRGMISPFSRLTIGNMYTEATGYISSLTYTVDDGSTWEVDLMKLPKYVHVACTFVYVGDRLPSSTQKHFDAEFISAEVYQTPGGDGSTGLTEDQTGDNKPETIPTNITEETAKSILDKSGLE